MVKRNVNGRKSNGTAGIAVIEDADEQDAVVDEVETSHHVEE